MLSVFAKANPMDVIQPWIAVVAGSVLLLYLLTAYGPIRRLYGNPGSVSAKEVTLFTFASVTLYLSFGGPLDYISDNYLFSAHMFQHMTEIVIMTPLFIAGTPDWMVRRLLDSRLVQNASAQHTHPIFTGLIFNGVIAIFHIPQIYDFALENEAFHFFEHLCFFVVALILWRSLWDLTPGRKMLALLLNYNLGMPLVIFMIIARHPWYTFYVSRPRIWPWLTPLADQQWGAIIMAVMMMGAFAVVGVRAYAKQDESIWYA
ncbi:cytochrome c oxidase assembly protein [Alicyclobacillus sp. ALC3]|uniref:cytochrome c oxidase assembly protein n=1 Tax=Alicyclobacillus sp. ALC3 TaxID=2796143 RepID=UPI00237806A5|nr:cytochrome c oxidase assembly protein [Alicyclobacillus sp. ALC3]WDL99247.1 cytochrome c oxidase assembly protein [Alicyclobacillus sp. ALC3]